MKKNFLGTAIRGAFANILVSKITEALVQAPGVPVSRENSVVVRPQVREAVIEVLEQDPVLKNELNAEKPVQSRILWGNSIATIGTFLAGILPLFVALGLITQEESQQILDGWAVIGQAIGVVLAFGGLAYSFYGRLASGLKPLFNKAGT